jgi:hypothetical protein
MNDVNQPDLELRLRDHYRTLDSGSSHDLAARVAEGLNRAPGRRWSPFRMPRRTAAAAAIGVAALAVMAVLTAPLWFGQATPVGPAASASSTATLVASGSPSSSPSSPPAETPTPTLGPAKCESFPATTDSSAVGWRGTRVVVLADYQSGCSNMSQELLSVDPALGKWRSDAALQDIVGSVSTDGSSIAISTSDGGVLVIDASDKQHDVPPPSGAAQNFAAYGLRVLPGGGYLVTGGDKLYRVASDGGGVTTDPLPAGYVAVAPTSDPNMFILAPTEDANVPYGLSGRSPFRAYLWNLRTGRLKLVAPSIDGVEMSPNSLAYLDSTIGYELKTVSLAADGSTKAVKRPGVLVGWISPDGSRYVFVPDQNSSAPQTAELRETATGHVLAKVEGVAIGTVVWNGNVAALVSGSDLVILDGSTATRVPLP